MKKIKYFRTFLEGTYELGGIVGLLTGILLITTGITLSLTLIGLIIIFL